MNTSIIQYEVFRLTLRSKNNYEFESNQQQTDRRYIFPRRKTTELELRNNSFWFQSYSVWLRSHMFDYQFSWRHSLKWVISLVCFASDNVQTFSHCFVFGEIRTRVDRHINLLNCRNCFAICNVCLSVCERYLLIVARYNAGLIYDHVSDVTIAIIIIYAIVWRINRSVTPQDGRSNSVNWIVGLNF